MQYNEKGIKEQKLYCYIGAQGMLDTTPKGTVK